MIKRRTPEERQRLQTEKEERQRIRKETLAVNKRVRLDKRNEKRLNERANTFADKQIADIKDKLKTTDELTYEVKINNRIKGNNRTTYLKAVIDKVNKLDEDKQKYISQKDNPKDYALNQNNKQVIQDFIEGKTRTTNYGKESDEEVEEIIEDTLKLNKSLIIKLKPFIHNYPKKRGAFFPYYNKSALDLTDYQITNGAHTYYKDNRTENIQAENCLIYAFRLLNMNALKLDRIKKYIVGQKVILADLKQIADDLNIKIILHQRRNNNISTKSIYGINNDETYNIALHSGHYFKYETTIYTSYYINNYNNLLNVKNANYIYKIRDGTYRRDAKRCINSLELIDLLTINKETFLIEITNQTINDYDKQFNPIKLKNNFDKFSLNYTDKDRLTRPAKTKTDEEDEAEEPEEGQKKPNKIIKYILYADFETITDENNELKADMIIGHLYDRNNNFIKSISKDLNTNDFIRTFLYEAVIGDTIIYFHNAKFDYNYLIREINGTSEIMNAGTFITHSGRFNKHRIIIKDSYKIITAPLVKFPKLFNKIKVDKEYINHNFYNINNIYENHLFTQEDFLEQFRPSGKYPQSNIYNDETASIVLNNCKRLGFITNEGLIDALKYRSYYCDMDCRILAEGMLTIRKQYLDAFNIDIYDTLTTPAIANRFLTNENVYDGCYELTGHLREYIEGSIVGGRVMTANNEKIYLKGKLADFDGRSLYPSAMVRIEGLPKGKPKVLNENQLDYNIIKSFDWYVVDVKITDLKIKRAFPLQSIKNKEGTRIFTNDIIGHTFRVDKIQLEDLINFQGVSFNILKGLYYNEGFNTKLKDVIQGLYDTRRELKANGDDRENIYKLILNSSYGKLIQKEHTEETKIKTGANNINTYISRNYNEIKDISYYDDRDGREKARISISSGRKAHFNLPHLGGMILSMSKRIMNEVICLAEDNGINIFYQDTDSLHLHSDEIPRLRTIFYNTYNRVLEGDDLGQFHSDLEMQIIPHGLTKEELKKLDIYSTEFIAIDKKTYIHKIEGVYNNNIYDGGYMVRCKGISRASIEYFNRLNNIDMREFFKRLYNCEKITCDLCGGGDILKLNIDCKRNIVNKKDIFIRTLHFPKLPISGFITG